MEKIRDAIESDLPTIVNIYNASIPSRIATGDLQEISVESRLKWFNDHSPEHYPLWVMEVDDKIAGWLGFQAFYYGRPAYNKTAEISLYISPHYQRQGVGKTLLQQAIKKAPSLDLKTLLGFIFAHNQPSLNLFIKHKFQKWGYLPQVAELDEVKRDLIIVGRTLN
ncbi:MAG TPA: N-acetyltransferase [Cyanothece sp. UBA12306]|nr:N-acetyltransferase [Cyanothece sp. UBA12306]